MSAKSLRSMAGSSSAKRPTSPSGDEAGEQLAGVAGHVLVDALQPLDEALGVVVAVPVLPDLLDDLRDGLAVALGRLDGHAGGRCGSTRAACRRSSRRRRSGSCRRQVGRPPRAAAEHLLEQDAGLHRAQEDEELEVGDVDAGGEQVDGDDDFGVRPVAELADPLQRPIDAAGDLGDERRRPGRRCRGPASTSWSACDVCGRSLAAKMSVFGKRPVSASWASAYFLSSSRILRLESGAVISRSTFAASKARSSSSRSSCVRRSRVDLVDLLALVEEHAVHADVAVDAHDVVVDEVALADGALVVVAVDQVLEVGHRVGGRRGGQPDLDGVEVVERVPPDRQLLG